MELITRSLTRKPSRQPYTVRQLLEACQDLEFRAAAGESGMDCVLATAKVQLLGLALAGFTDDIETGSVQILAGAELRYIAEQLTKQSAAFLDPVFHCGIGCFLVAEGLQLPKAFLDKADQFGVAVLWTSKGRLQSEALVVRTLEEELAPSISFHGDLVVFCGLGLLILGKSGIGKSDCALDLITHGHQLVADDNVHVRRNPLGQLIGKGDDAIPHHMDIRGLGIINVKELFSVYSVMEEHGIDLVIFLEPWNPKENYARKREERMLEILGVPKPLLRLPVAPGRNWENLIQVAARNFILKSKGYDADRALSDKLARMLEKPPTT